MMRAVRQAQTTVEYLLVLSMVTIIVVAGYTLAPVIEAALRDLAERAETAYTDASIAQ
jgi:hypothetical protein